MVGVEGRWGQWVSPGSTVRKGRKDRCWLKQEVQSSDYLLKKKERCKPEPMLIGKN